MRLTDHDLKQINQKYLASLSPEQLLYLSEKMLDDLRTARERLNQTPQNSSRPSGSFAPWEQASFGSEKSRSDDDEEKEDEDEKAKPEKTDKGSKSEQSGTNDSTQQLSGQQKPGKQPGAKGVGRKVEMAVTGEQRHMASVCTGCGNSFGEDVLFQPTTGRYVLDIAQTERGMRISNVKHIYGKRCCDCGHVTQTEPGRCDETTGVDSSLDGMASGGAVALCSHHLSIHAHAPVFAETDTENYCEIGWVLNSAPVVSTNASVKAGGQSPLWKRLLVAEIQQSELLHADETGWKENGHTVWLWVLRTASRRSI